MGACSFTPELAFEGRRFRVERRRFELDGRWHTHDIVVHPGAAVALPLFDDGRVVLIRNRRIAIDEELIELPAGTLDPGESPLECAARELAEETGYRADHLVPLVTLYSSPGIMTEQMYAFLATGLRPGPAARDSTEQIVVVEMPLDEVLAAIRAGRITDGKTVATLLFYDRFVRGGGR